MDKNIISSRRKRIFAALIDHVILSFLAAIACFFVLGNDWDLSGKEEMDEMLSVILIVCVLYVLKDSVAGMSPGRFIMGIAVSNYSAPGSVPNIFRLALRNFPLLIIWPVEFFVLAFSKQKRRLGDFISGTIVVKREDISTYKRVLVSVLFVLIFIILIFTSTGMVIKNSSAYRNAVTYIEASSEIEAEVGDILGYGFFPKGSVQVKNQYGYAQLRIKIRGENGSIFALLKMERKPDLAWQVIEMNVEK